MPSSTDEWFSWYPVRTGWDKKGAWAWLTWLDRHRGENKTVYIDRERTE